MKNLLCWIWAKIRGGASFLSVGRVSSAWPKDIGKRLSSFDRREWQRQWKDGVSRLGKKLDRQQIAQLKSFQAIKKFDYEHFFEKVYSPQSYRIIHWGFLTTVCIIAMYMVGKMVAYMVIPQERPVAYKTNPGLERLFARKGQSDVWNSIVMRDLFRTGSEGNSAADSPRKDKAKRDKNLLCNDSNKKSTLPFELINAVVLQNSEKSVASVKYRGKKKILYLQEGDSVENISVKKISWLRMVFINHQSGQCEYIVGNTKDDSKLWQEARPKIISPEKGRKLIEGQKNENVVKVKNTFQVKKEVKEDILNNINTILTQAKAVEIKNPDGSLCFKMVDIVPGSAYSTFDVQNDDIICNINGKKIEDLNSLFALFGKMRDVKHFEMVIKRDGQEIPMEYNFE